MYEVTRSYVYKDSETIKFAGQLFVTLTVFTILLPVYFFVKIMKKHWDLYLFRMAYAERMRKYFMDSITVKKYGDEQHKEAKEFLTPNQMFFLNKKHGDCCKLCRWSHAWCLKVSTCACRRKVQGADGNEVTACSPCCCTNKGYEYDAKVVDQFMREQDKHYFDTIAEQTALFKSYLHKKRAHFDEEAAKRNASAQADRKDKSALTRTDADSRQEP